MTQLPEIINSININGLAIGLATFIAIGLFHPLVIKGEYYLGARCCIPLFTLTGIVTAIASLLTNHQFISPVLGVVAFSSFWSIKEVREQEQRVARGWFPRNPRRKATDAHENAGTED